MSIPYNSIKHIFDKDITLGARIERDYLRIVVSVIFKHTDNDQVINYIPNKYRKEFRVIVYDLLKRIIYGGLYEEIRFMCFDDTTLNFVKNYLREYEEQQLFNGMNLKDTILHNICTNSDYCRYKYNLI